MRALLILAAAPLVLGACQSNWEKEGRAAQASGQGATRTFDATGFTGVDLRGSDDVEVRVGQTWSVRAEGDSKELDRLEIRLDGSTLRVGRKDNDGFNWGSHRGVKVYVTLPKLAMASVAGSGNLDADRAEGDFHGSVAGSGNLNIAALNGGAADLSVAGSGNLKVAGTVSSFDANIAGSGDLDAQGLSASSANVSIAGSGNVRATVNGQASVSIVGSGDADLGSGAKCSVSKLGSGDVRCGG